MAQHGVLFWLLFSMLQRYYYTQLRYVRNMLQRYSQRYLAHAATVRTTTLRMLQQHLRRYHNMLQRHFHRCSGTVNGTELFHFRTFFPTLILSGLSPKTWAVLKAVKPLTLTTSPPPTHHKNANILGDRGSTP